MRARFFKRLNQPLKRASFVAAAILQVAYLAQPIAASAFSGTGVGTAQNPYKVATCEQLQAVQEHPAAHYVQIADIDCSGTSSWNSGAGFSPIGTDTTPFTGVYDGQNFAINDLSLTVTGDVQVSLFGVISNATVKNVNLRGGQLSSASQTHSASLITSANHATISNCSSTMTVSGLRIAGLIGTISNDTTVDRCYFSGSVTTGVGSTIYGYGASLVGGVDHSSITNSYVTGTFSFTGPYNGSLVGYIDNASTLSDSYSTAAVTSRDGSSYISGLIGRGSLNATSTISHVFFAGTFNKGGSTRAGAIIGLEDGTTINFAVYDSTACAGCTSVGFYASGSNNIAGYAGPSAFYANTYAPVSYWDVTTVWQLNSGTFPTLRATAKPSDPDSDGASSATEAAAPNNGDGNNDGIADNAQTNVASFVNSITGQYAVLATSCDSISNAQVNAEAANAAPDSVFDYPLGLMGFHLNCNTPGETATVTQYYYVAADPGTVVARKYNSISHTYQAIPGATVSRVTIGSKQAIKLSYQITDGGALDEDGTANGTIVDPSGLALSLITAPNTGLGGSQLR